MGQFDPVTMPGGYVAYLHRVPPQPRRSIHPTTDGGAFATEHGYVEKRRLIARWVPEGEIETLVAAQEEDGFVREGEPSIDFSITEAIALYDVSVWFERYLPEAPSEE